MSKVIQCVPNFSEGRDLDKIEKIVAPLKNKEGFKLLSYEPDGDHNRTVVNLLGDPEAIIPAVLEMVRMTTELIDLNEHEGEHPRMGATDVIPFIPIRDCKLEDCVTYSERMAQLLNDELNIPIFLYAESARKKDRKKLPTIRKGQFEGMKEKIQEENWAPDFGKAEIHPTAGTTACGARIPLLAYNINLDTTNSKVAGAISKAIRFSSGGFRFVQAGPMELTERNIVQVSMNILDFNKNSIYRIYETVKMEALRYGVEVVGSEVIGSFPLKAVTDSLKYYFARDNREVNIEELSFEEVAQEAIKYMGFEDFTSEKILEANL